MAANPALEPLAPLIGEWEVRVPQFGDGTGRVTIEWLDEGAYLRMRTLAPEPAPAATFVIGRDETVDEYTCLYHDSRGVSRIYQMTFDGHQWRMWREAPAFNQRFTGRLRDDGTEIRAAWEMSEDGASWAHDFDLIYTRMSS